MKARFGFVLTLCATALAACGGGGGGGGTPPTVAPSTVPTATPPASLNVTFGAAPASVQIPSGAGVYGTISLPGGSGSATISASATNPKAVPVVQLRRRDTSGGNTALAYITLTATSAVTMNGLPGFSVTLPSGAASGTYFVAYYDLAGQQPAWVSTTQTGAAPSQGVVTIPAATSPIVALRAGDSIYLAVYVGGYIPPINVNGCTGIQLKPFTGAGPSADLVGVHPITSGDSYAYSGNLTQTIVRTEPCVQPPATATANVNITVGTTGSVENSTETDAYATNTTTLTTAANVSLSSGIYRESSETATDTNFNRIDTQYTAPGLEYARQNEGPSTWTNASPATVTQTLADGSVLARTYQAAGTYTETDTIPGGGSNIVTVSNDGSGSYVIGSGTSGATTLGIGAPSNNQITITLGAQSLTIPSWLPSPLTLYSDSTQDIGSATGLPPGCTFVVGGNGTPEHIVRTVKIVDPVLGYIETQTTDMYDLTNYNGGAGLVTLGPVCATISDTMDQYYDYSVTTTGAGLYFSLDAKPVITNTISESLSLGQGGGLIAHRVTRDAAKRLRSQIRARQAGISFVRAMQRASGLRALHTAARKTLGGLQ
ncbi:MAG TPA: hypothetical protein VGN11_08545 [Candidatus Baltobacteraceae bacterium]|nr:hypothetical protein [Candidatus Baltobacteraceae bacterium]